MTTNRTRIPAPLDPGKHAASVMSYLWTHYQEYKTLSASQEEPLMTVDADRFACGFPLPPFQREQCWTEGQQAAFIESAWLGLPLGTYTHHDIDWGNAGHAKPFSGWLIDGQQRLTAIEGYWEDRFPVFGLYWSELTRTEQRRFKAIKFPHYEASLWNEAAIRDLYNRLALGGVPHRPDQRA